MHARGPRPRGQFGRLAPPPSRPTGGQHKTGDIEIYTPSRKVFARFIRLPNGRRTLRRKLRSIGEADTPIAYPSVLWLSCPIEMLGRFLEAVPESTYVVHCVRSRYDLRHHLVDVLNQQLDWTYVRSFLIIHQAGFRFHSPVGDDLHFVLAFFDVILLRPCTSKILTVLNVLHWSSAKIYFASPASPRFAIVFHFENIR